MKENSKRKSMWYRYPAQVLKMTLFIALLALVGIIGFCHFSDNYNAYIILSDSMKPTINSGDLVIVGKPGNPLVGDIKPETIVTYRHGEELVTHRVVSVNGDSLVTRGDAVEEADPWAVSGFYDVMGCYIIRIPYIGMINDFMRTKLGWFVTIIMPALLLLALIVREIIREAFSSNPVIN